MGKNINKEIDEKKEKRIVKWFVFVCIAVFVFTILFYLHLFTGTSFNYVKFKLEPVFHKEVADITDAIEYDPAEGTFFLTERRAYIVCDYDYAELYINGRKIDSDENIYSDGVLDFTFYSGTIPINRLFDAVVVFYNENNEIAETIVARDIILLDKNVSRVKNAEEVKILFSGGGVNIEDVIKCENVEALNIISYLYDGDMRLLSELKHIRFLRASSSRENLLPLETIGEMTSLENLEISRDEYGMNFQVDMLLNLVNLKKLSFYQSDTISVDFENFKNLTNLETLSIAMRGENIYKLNDLSSLPRLIELDIKIKGGENINLSPIGNITSLRIVDIYCSDVKACDITGLNTLTNLERINIYGSESVTGDLHSISNMDNIEYIYIDTYTNENGEVNEYSLP